MNAPCQRFEREGLGGWLPPEELDDGELAAHVASCAQCLAEQQRYTRLAAAMQQLGAGAARRTDHVARALAAAGQARPIDSARRRRRWLGASAAVSLAAAALLWWRWPAPVEPELTVELVATAKPVLRGTAHLGDKLRLRARKGAALWVYRNDRTLVLECPRQCQRDDRAIVGEVALDEVGRYQVVWLMPEPGLVPQGVLDADLAAARQRGARHQLREIEVQ